MVSKYQHELLLKMYDNFANDITVERAIGTDKVNAFFDLKGKGFVVIYKMDYGCIGGELTQKGWRYAEAWRTGDVFIG